MKRALIVIDGSPNDRESLACAVLVCRITEAALTVAAARVPHRTVGLFADIAPAQSAEEMSANARASFDALCGDLPGAEFVSYNAEASEIISAIGHAYDLVIVERIARDDGPEIDSLNAALFDTGRPALITPPQLPQQIGRRIAVVWNDTVQAARAIGSALALLTRAEEVVLLLGSDMNSEPPLPMADYLRIHGASVTVQPYDSGQLTARGRGRALLKAASRSEADLLVTGAYGHGEGGLGGLGRATQKVVTGARIPVLLQS